MPTEKDNNENEEVTSYKGFDKDMKCRGFQFEIGKEFVHDGEVKACNGGFHACEHPLNVFNYYPPATSRYATVQQSGNLSRHGEDSKIASRKIKITAEIGIPDLIKAAIEYTFSRALPINPESPASATGDQGAASATGDQGAASATGDQGAASATGYQGRAQGKEGCAIFLVYRNDEYEIIHARGAIVGKDGIKPDTYYTLSESGEFVEV